MVNMHTIKPIDKKQLLIALKTNYMFVEEHNIIGGLASAISEV